MTETGASAAAPTDREVKKKQRVRRNRPGGARGTSASSVVAAVGLIALSCFLVAGVREKVPFSSVMMVEAQFIEALLNRAGVAGQPLPPLPPLYDEEIVLQEEAWERMHNETPPAKLRGLQAMVPKEVPPEFDLMGDSTTGIILNITANLLRH